MGVDPTLVVVQLLSLACVVHLWTRSTQVWRKALWSLLVILPIAGPIYYCTACDPPDVQDEVDRAKPTTDLL